MNTEEVILMYEEIAAITSRMASAAQAGDTTGLEALKDQYTHQASATATGVPPLEGPLRLRKIELLKHIMANDRAVREVTEPWTDPLDRIMHRASKRRE
jgi:flagellar protein FliT